MPLVVFTTALLTLAVEVFYTRLFSALFWKNAAFAILSLAMLGIGASGVLVYLRPSWFPEQRASRQVAWLLSAFGLSILVSYLWVLALSRGSFNAMEPLETYVVLVVAGLLPFFFGGLLLTIVFTHGAARIPQLYRIDLVAAAIGAVIVLPLMRLLNGPLLVPVLALGASLPAFVLSRMKGLRGPSVFAAVLSLVFLVVGVLHHSSGVLNVTHSHGQKEQNVEIERWDPLARIRVQSFGPQSKWLDIDSQVVTAILRYRGEAAEVDYLQHNVLQLAYRLRKYPEVLIIGPGGGSDVLSALTSGNRSITGVEVNRTTIALMRGELAEYTGRLYHHPAVKIHIADGRAYVAAMKEKKDLIQATFVDTFTSSAAGSHTLSENYLYTVDGFHDFLDHLNTDGILSMSRWGGEGFSFAETHRAVGLALTALEERKVANPAAHVVVVQGAPPERLTLGGGYQMPGQFAESMSTLLVKATPFTSSELDRLEDTVRVSGFRMLWMGDRGGPDETLVELFRTKDREPLYRAYHERTGLDISPVTDDRPFYFDMIDPTLALFQEEREEWRGHIYYFSRWLDIHMLHQLLYAVSLVAGLLLVVPLLGRLRDIRGVRRPVSLLGYFVCLGIGFIGIELSLMQRFALFLEHPVYSLVVFLSSVLLWSGLGSARTARVRGEWAREGARRAGLLVVILLVYGFLVPPLTRALIGLPLVFRMAIAVGLAFPPAFLMGMLFPLGVAVVRERSPGLVPWVWGLNSAFSVVGAVASLFLAMSFGHTVTWLVFASAYGLAAVAMWRLAGPRAA